MEQTSLGVLDHPGPRQVDLHNRPYDAQVNSDNCFMATRAALPFCVASLVLLTGVMSGCMGPASTEVAGTKSERITTGTVHRPVVVAMLDSGTNPYHQVFATNDSPWDKVDFGGLAPIPLTMSSSGTYDERVEHDASTWSSVQPATLYGFQGTRLMGISISHPPQQLPMLDYLDHGSLTSGLVANSSPDSVIVMVQINSQYCVGRSDCLLDPSVADGMEWIAAQPWIDVVTHSVGLVTNFPDPEALHPEARRFVDATKRAADGGKILVGAAGNSVAPPAAGYTAGPPWMISVGGIQPVNKGEAPYASRLVDVVANYSGEAPAGDDTNSSEWSSGTSFAAPVVAGTLAQAIAIVRAQLEHDGGITPDGALATGTDNEGKTIAIRHDMVRAAMNRTARHLNVTDWDPTVSPRNDPVRDLLAPHLPILAPEIQMGWGWVTPDLSTEIAHALLTGELEPGPEKSRAAQVQSINHDMRHRLWDGT